MSISTIENLIEQFEMKRQELQEQIRGSLRDAFTEFFNQHPDIDNITFTAYVPYFNDGDECVFGIRGDILFSNVSEKEDPYQNGFYFTTYNSELNAYDDVDDQVQNYIDAFNAQPEEVRKKKGEAFKAIDKFINHIKDFIQQICGSHVWVTINREGIHVEEYDDHD